MLLGKKASLVAQTVKRLPTMRETRFDPWVGKILWRRKWQPTPVFLPGKSHGWKNLVGYSPRGRSRLSDFTFFHVGDETQENSYKFGPLGSGPCSLFPAFTFHSNYNFPYLRSCYTGVLSKTWLQMQSLTLVVWLLGKFLSPL